MDTLKRTLKIRLPLTEAEKTCLSQYMSTYPKACNYVSKYIYKHEVLSQQELLKVLREDLNKRYNMNSYAAKSVIKTVAALYKERKSDYEKWKRLKFKKHQFHWGIDYVLKENEFYLRTCNEKINFEIVDYNRYFDMFLDIFFGPATIQKGSLHYYLHIPITITGLDMTNRAKLRVLPYIWWLWRPIKKNLVQK